MVNTCWTDGMYFIYSWKLFNLNLLKAHYQQSHPISMKEGLLPDGTRFPEGWNRLKQLWFDCSLFTYMAIDEVVNNWSNHRQCTHSTTTCRDSQRRNNRPLKPDMTCPPDTNKPNVHKQVVGVDNAEGKAYGKATGLYYKHYKYLEQRNPWQLLQWAHKFQQA